jgi:hypothetical protein
VLKEELLDPVKGAVALDVGAAAVDVLVAFTEEPDIPEDDDEDEDEEDDDDEPASELVAIAN